MTDAVKQLREYLNDGPHDTYAPYEIADEALTALEAVLDLHRPYEWLFRYEPITSCMHCAHISTVEHKYPCSTVRAITDALKGAD